jgi:hypothetical protein
MIEAIRSSETSVLTTARRRNVSEDVILLFRAVDHREGDKPDLPVNAVMKYGLLIGLKAPVMSVKIVI